MITVACWKWRPAPGYRSSYGPEQVNTLYAMVERHLRCPHEFVCVTDDAAGLDPRIRVAPLPVDFADVRSPHGPSWPSCYRRLAAFAPDAAHWLGERILSLDLDVVITGDITGLAMRPEDFVIAQGSAKGTAYNGGLWLLTAGSRPQVFERFHPVKSPALTYRLKIQGSDQAWLSYILGRGEARFTDRDGVYSYRVHMGSGRHGLPADARLVLFSGKIDPWQPRALASSPWIRQHYHREAPVERGAA